MTLSPLYSTSHIFKSSIAKSQTQAAHKVQLYLDYDCPFSRKLFNKFNDGVITKIDEKHPEKFEFILMNVPQPWHPTSTLMHEVALAVGKLEPQSFWEFSSVLFNSQEAFFDTETYDKSRGEIYKDLIKLATDKFPNLSAEKLYSLVEVKATDKPSNGGNNIAKDFKYFVRYHRTVGVHVTPTISVDGIINPGIESSNSIESIVEKLESYL